MDADTTALAIIQKWIRPDDKVKDMTGFYEALVEALRAARSEGEEEANAEEGSVASS
jgi:hypothetical protein